MTYFILFLACVPFGHLIAAEPPQSVIELWADFNPRKDPLDVEVIREWKEDGGVYRYMRYTIGTFKGQPAYMAAFYGFPESTAGSCQL